MSRTTTRPTSWLALIGGVRQSHFQAAITENAVYPRIGVAVQIPKLNWVFRGFYGHYYQPPPLTTISGPVLEYANGTNTSFAALHGERDEEHQFGVQIPFRGWLLDADTFQTRANNFLDHSNIGESSIFIPVTVQGALIQAWELTLRSPQSWRYGQFHLAYSNQIAQQIGPITGGLICYPPDSAGLRCCAGIFAAGSRPAQHAECGLQRQTSLSRLRLVQCVLRLGILQRVSRTLRRPIQATTCRHTQRRICRSGNHLARKFTVSATAINVANTRVLLDNSLTFGGFHYNDPRTDLRRGALPLSFLNRN